MRFLEDHEIPEPERSRRLAIRQTVEVYQKAIADEMAKAAPSLVRMICNGEYEAERDFRNALDSKTERLRQEAARLMQELPPYLEMREDEFFERVAIVPAKQRA